VVFQVPSVSFLVCRSGFMIHVPAMLFVYFLLMVAWFFLVRVFPPCLSVPSPSLLTPHPPREAAVKYLPYAAPLPGFWVRRLFGLLALLVCSRPLRSPHPDSSLTHLSPPSPYDPNHLTSTAGAFQSTLVFLPPPPTPPVEIHISPLFGDFSNGHSPVRWPISALILFPFLAGSYSLCRGFLRVGSSFVLV